MERRKLFDDSDNEDGDTGYEAKPIEEERVPSSSTKPEVEQTTTASHEP